MNENRRLIIIMSMLVALGMIGYPPWQYVEIGTWSNMTMTAYGFIFSPPGYMPEIMWGRLFLQLAGVALLAGIGWAKTAPLPREAQKD